MHRSILLGLLVALATSPALAEADPMPGHDPGHRHAAEAAAPTTSTPDLADRTLAIDVRGMVCSFCAHGLEKGLSKLDGLDTDRHGDGVLVDIEAHRVTLALATTDPIPFADITRRIEKAGYDATRFHLRVQGAVDDGPEGPLLRGSHPAQAFLLDAPVAEADAAAGVQLQVDVANLAGLPEDAPIPAAVHATR